MRVLLYETGESGHRGLYRHYYETAVRSAGIDAVVYSGPPYEGLLGFNAHLQQLAKAEACDLVHLLTMDDHTKRIFFSAPCTHRRKNIPVVGTYYLFANLQGGPKALAFRWCWHQGKLAAIIIPKAAGFVISDIELSSGIPIYLLPDPVKTSGNKPLNREAALEELGIPSDWCDKTIVLIFGILNKRRGIDFLAEAVRASIEASNNLKFVFAGRLDRASLTWNTIFILRTLHGKGDAMLVDRWLSDAEVEKLYTAADVFCIQPEHGFAGINSTAMRALDFGLVVVAPKDCFTSRCALAIGKGATYRRGEVGDLIRVLKDIHERMIVPNRGKPREQESILTVDTERFGKTTRNFYQDVLLKQANESNR